MTLELCLQVAGVVQLGIASANVVAARMFRYREGLATAPEVIRQVFWVQNVFIVLVLVGASLLCLAWPAELTSGDRLARGISAFLAVFWGVRLITQFVYYSPEKRRQFRVMNALFVVAFIYLTAVFAIAAL